MLCNKINGSEGSEEWLRVVGKLHKMETSCPGCYPHLSTNWEILVAKHSSDMSSTFAHLRYVIAISVWPRLPSFLRRLASRFRKANSCASAKRSALTALASRVEVISPAASEPQNNTHLWNLQNPREN